MRKEKTVRTYQRRTKSGKMATVKQHTAKYDAAEALKEAAKKKGAGEELDALKKKSQTKPAKEAAPKDDALGFTADEYKAWYHWDQDADPKNAAAKKVEKALKKQMGAKAYNKYFVEMTDNYSARGHNKAFKGLGEKFSTGEDKKSGSLEASSKKDSHDDFVSRLPKGSFHTVDAAGKEIPDAPKHGTKSKVPASAKTKKAELNASKSISPFSGQAQLKQEIATWKKSPTGTTGKASRNNITKILKEKKKQGYKLTKREEAFLGD